MVGLCAKLSVAALCVIALNSVCAANEWWENGHFYQIYPRSYQDSDGDGVGDLKGITKRLEYLKYIGVTGVWLSPIFASPMADFGYDISDYRQIHYEFGTMDDFDNLVKRCKELDLKLILDFVPNHSSNKHEWFIKSSDKTHAEFEKYKDYYIWNEGTLLEDGTRRPPSNWLSIFRGSAWTWVESRGAFYYHQFLAEQPDLNYRNPNLVNEMKDILRFWLDKGVAGFRCDAVPYLFEVKENDKGLYDDEPLSGQCGDDKDAHCYLKHPYTSDLDETPDMIYQWREVTDTYDNPKRIMMTEAYTSLPNTLKYYGKVENGKILKYGSQVPFNFELISYTNFGSTAKDFLKNIDNWLSGMPQGALIHPNWVLGNHDNKRLASRYGPARTDLFNILLKTLPGVTVTYQGEELGLTDVYISWKDTKDPQACRTNEKDFHKFSRDPARTPFQWDDSKNSGFSVADKTWLPVADNYTENNVKLQKSQPISHLKVLRQLIKMRQNPTMEYGALDVKAPDDDLLIYKREYSVPATDKFVVLLNLGGTEKTVDLNSLFENLPKTMKVATISTHAKKYLFGDPVETSNAVLEPNVGIVLVGKN